MATYKKKGHKPTDKGDQQRVDESQSTTAEVFNILDDTASKSEQWIEKNSKPLFYGLVIIVVLGLGLLAYNKFVTEPAELAASNELAFPRKYFNDASVAGSSIDSLLNLGLEGADGKYGFVDIAVKFSGTKAGNLANYYAGVSYLQLKEYDKAIEYLEKFNSDDALLGPVALGAMGDAFADINQPEQALEYYTKAANLRDNEFTTPLFLEKAGFIALELKEFAKAESLFSKIKAKYSKSEQGTNVDKYINAAKYAE
ncbi:tetratricopeptide repeat protein [Polaribacter sp. HL-MS24]|uniref:tetratricopeptide repeat protein n=1 Tax=Polaribacter sp. HL-MS24 TaxID=3077735 RepID=UPI002934D93D|nr:tetratricopeptide repeat protein [Polaribacter sp. HL-MS24]WOC40346.1 tetratricopeptide repeat protein [Polaribacter sp. HL-MS24]